MTTFLKWNVINKLILFGLVILFYFNGVGKEMISNDFDEKILGDLEGGIIGTVLFFNNKWNIKERVKINLIFLSIEILCYIN